MILKVTFSEDELVGIDALRGGVPRATWVRGLVRAHGLGSLAGVAASTRVMAPGAQGVGGLGVSVAAGAPGHRDGCGCLNCERARGTVR